MRIYFLVLSLMLAACTASAEAPPKVERLIEQMFNDENRPDQVRETDVPGIYEIIAQGQVSYIDMNNELFIAGKIYRLSDYSDLSKQSLREYRQQWMQGVDESNTVTYAPAGYKHTVYVFTDVDCHYCRLFHKNMKEMNDLGIRVSYLFTPYQGKQSRARAEGVWCSKQRQATMDRAKAGKDIPLKECATPIDEHLQLARRFGVTGTPGILLEDGTLLRGMRSPQELLAEIKKIALK